MLLMPQEVALRVCLVALRVCQEKLCGITSFFGPKIPPPPQNPPPSQNPSPPPLSPQNPSYPPPPPQIISFFNILALLISIR